MIPNPAMEAGESDEKIEGMAIALHKPPFTYQGIGGASELGEEAPRVGWGPRRALPAGRGGNGPPRHVGQAV